MCSIRRFCDVTAQDYSNDFIQFNGKHRNKASPSPGRRTSLAALDDSFSFDPLIGVIGVMADKDYEGLLSEFEPVLAHVVCTQNSTSRSMPSSELAEVALGIFGQDRVSETASLAEAIDQAATLAEAGGVFGEAIGSGGVLVTGSVVTVGEARAMLRSHRNADGSRGHGHEAGRTPEEG